MPNENIIDTLQIEIEASSKNASVSLSKLANSIKKLDELGKSRGGIPTLIKKLHEFSTLNLSKVSGQLSKIATSLKTISKYQDLAKKITTTSPVQPLENLSTENPIQNADMGIDSSVMDAILKIQEDSIQANDSGQDFFETIQDSAMNASKAIEGVGEEIVKIKEQKPPLITTTESDLEDAVKTAPAAERVNHLTQVFSMFGRKAREELALVSEKQKILTEKVAASTERVAILRQNLEKITASEDRGSEKEIISKLALSNAEMALYNLKEQARKTNEELQALQNRKFKKLKDTREQFANFGASLKRIALYRIIRGLLSQITQAAKQGIQNFSQYNADAKKGMTELSATKDYLVNTLGATIAPLIVQLLPVITKVVDGLVSAINEVQYFIALITNQGYYDRAIKNNDEYTKSIEDIGKATIGIDELNIIQKDDAPDYSKMFERIEIPTRAAELFKLQLKTIVPVLATIAAIALLITFTIGWIPILIIAIIAGIALLIIYWEDIIAWIKKGLSSLGEYLGIGDSLVVAFEWVVNVIKGYVSFLIDFWKTYFTSFVDFFKERIFIILDFIKGIIAGVQQILSGDVIGGLKTIFHTVVEAWIRSFNSFLNFFIDMINVVIRGLNKIHFSIPDWVPGIGGRSFGGINLPEVPAANIPIPRFATGGFPEDDSLIYVNPYELVGQMSNGKNVVANNEQIIEGIRQGVYDAVLSANAQNNNSGTRESSLEVKVYLDGRQIGAVVDKQNKQKGVGTLLYAGGAPNGY